MWQLGVPRSHAFKVGSFGKRSHAPQTRSRSRVTQWHPACRSCRIAQCDQWPRNEGRPVELKPAADRRSSSRRGDSAIIRTRGSCGIMRLAAFIFVVLFSSSCLPGYGYVAADYVPPHYERYPSTYYDGRAVYYIGGRWYARHRDHWVYYRREPPELHRYRLRIESAPSAHYRPQRPDYDRRVRVPHRAPPTRDRHRAPPARDPHRAPPAERVR